MAGLQYTKMALKHWKKWLPRGMVRGFVAGRDLRRLDRGGAPFCNARCFLSASCKRLAEARSAFGDERRIAAQCSGHRAALGPEHRSPFAGGSRQSPANPTPRHVLGI